MSGASGPSAGPVQHRTIVVGLVWNALHQLLLCKMPPGRGVFPGQWGLPGGGVEPGERIEDALRRELREELGIEIEAIRPAFFKDAQHEKAFPDGSRRSVYMVFLVFHCRACSPQIALNEEFTAYRWVGRHDVAALTQHQEMSRETIDTLARMGPWPGASRDPVDAEVRSV